MTGYCLKCKKAVEISEPKEVTFKNGRPAIKGTCPLCKTVICKICKKANA